MRAEVNRVEECAEVERDIAATRLIDGECFDYWCLRKRFGAGFCVCPFTLFVSFSTPILFLIFSLTAESPFSDLCQP